MAGCAGGYFADKSSLDGSNIDNTDDIAKNSVDVPGTSDAQESADDSQKDTGDQQNNTDNTGKDTIRYQHNNF